MKPVVRGTLAIAVLLALTGMTAPAWAQLGSLSAQNPIPVNSDNFVRAETDMYFAARAKENGLGKFEHRRQPLSIDNQSVIRGNRDTLYSTGVFDLEAGPVTITLPDAGSRFRSMLVITEDGYMPQVVYDAGRYSFTRAQIGTRYVMLGIRALVDPDSPDDLAKAHSVQDATKIEQPGGPGMFEVPNWDAVSQKKVRDALLVLYNMLPDQNRMFGTKEEVDPVRRLIGAAGGWGGNPDKEATYLNVNPKQNDGKIVHRLSVKDVPVDGFWSISVYNAQGYYEKNPQNAYSLNNITAKKNLGGSVTVQFGGCDGQIPNCLPVMKDWNYMVRLYRPRAEVLDGTWKFPEAEPMN